MPVGGAPYKNAHGERAWEFNLDDILWLETDGEDENGNPIKHHTWVNPITHSHISYDLRPNGMGGWEYVPGSGHERDDVNHKTVKRWD